MPTPIAKYTPSRVQIKRGTAGRSLRKDLYPERERVHVRTVISGDAYCQHGKTEAPKVTKGRDKYIFQELAGACFCPHLRKTVDTDRDGISRGAEELHK
jgi:hypothetical protein